jgi:predicted O-methyltransferase YrrM
MEFFSQTGILGRYLETHSTAEDPVLAELNRHTHLKEIHPRMLSGPVLGSFLTLFSSLLAPARILEIGTYTGYSAICLARGMRAGGTLTTLEINDELKKTALSFFEKAGVKDRIQLINGDAIKILPTLKAPFDLVFIDALKEDYLRYYELVYPALRPGGYILADNVLWGGKVLDPQNQDSATSAIRAFNTFVTKDQRVENHLLPLRDGVMVIKKI